VDGPRLSAKDKVISLYFFFFPFYSPDPDVFLPISRHFSQSPQRCLLFATAMVSKKFVVSRNSDRPQLPKQRPEGWTNAEWVADVTRRALLNGDRRKQEDLRP
jgi:hypothetical protein